MCVCVCVCVCVVQERKFLEQQQESMEKAMKRLAEQHREKVALLERQFLQQKQQLLRGMLQVGGGFTKERGRIEGSPCLSVST